MNCWLLCFLECPLCFAIIPEESTPSNCPESDVRCSDHESDMLKYLLSGVHEFRPISFELYANLMGQHLWTKTKITLLLPRLLAIIISYWFTNNISKLCSLISKCSVALRNGHLWKNLTLVINCDKKSLSVALTWIGEKLDTCHKLWQNSLPVALTCIC